MHEYTPYFLDYHSVHSMYFSYCCILSLDIKNPISCHVRVMSSFTVKKSKWYPFVNCLVIQKKSRVDMKHSVI